MFEESIEGGISSEIEVITLICSVENNVFTAYPFFINKHRSPCLEGMYLLSVSTDKFLWVFFCCCSCSFLVFVLVFCI